MNHKAFMDQLLTQHSEFIALAVGSIYRRLRADGMPEESALQVVQQWLFSPLAEDCWERCREGEATDDQCDGYDAA